MLLQCANSRTILCFIQKTKGGLGNHQRFAAIQRMIRATATRLTQEF